MKRLLAILILTTAALGVAACNNNGGGAGSSSGATLEPTMSIESPAASEMAPASEETSP